MEYEAVIGLEVHAHLLTASKIFCGCATAFGAPPNTQVCEVCLGMPGSLPVLNHKAVEFALKMALATNCRVNPESVFARKNYFYPDLPKGYQISQYELPLAEHGFLDIKVEGVARRIGITRIHMEEDAGKLIHSESRPVSFVDFNRTGVPLIEIVSEPDLRTPDEAVEYLKGLRNILLYLEICDGNMEEGSLRCDANISLRPVGQTGLGARAELKNMNSFRFVKAALEYEIKRQRALLTAGREIVQETRLWDTAANQTVSMRGKEEAHDYRYFPDPDLVPVRIEAGWLESLRKNLPELPAAVCIRFQTEYGLPEYDAEVLTSDKTRADKFEATVKGFPHLSPKQVSNWFLDDPTSMSTITPAASGSLLTLVEKGTISRNQAKEVLKEVMATGKDPETIIKEKGLAQISDASALKSLAQEIINANPQEAADYRAGKTKVMGFFVGQLMKQTRGQANPQLANEIFQRLLK
ncbi:MAG: Asp-tRNA(Asn)/Glu-tRNA(Gln) amidotransferase GatCAB subunit B [Deltaproteobacteria bacterium CG07_land_8_20_14_0_80_60_11]|nr:MAG: Asp-tRNA(Asn)/Glu-tRNA(Gln) amidotransferase GatCAB subunit B [Deltaproteobacteria bacterium CG07_land_8_20_14_0_80_60_11]